MTRRQVLSLFPKTPQRLAEPIETAECLDAEGHRARARHVTVAGTSHGIGNG